MKNSLIKDYCNNNLSNAYIVTGCAGDVYRAVIDFCLLLFCETGKACGYCASCKKILNEDHVDFHIIRRNSKNIINVEDAEAIISQAAQKSFEGKFKLFYIEEADNMNEAAQNKLLKIIEEPPEKTLFIFGVENISNLLPTIISRCAVIHSETRIISDSVKLFTEQMKVNHNIAEVLVLAANGDYSKAQQLYEADYIMLRDDIVSVVIKILFARNYAFSSILETIESYSKNKNLIFLAFNLVLYDLLYVKMNHSIIYNIDKLNYFEDVCNKTDLVLLLRLLRIVARFHLRLKQASGVSMHLLYESMILSMIDVSLNNNKKQVK